MERWEAVYCVLAGEWDGSSSVSWVVEGCDYSEVYEAAHKNLTDARNRLCDRFQLNAEDEDLEEIMNAVLQIERDISRRAFLCGYRNGAWNAEKKE